MIGSFQRKAVMGLRHDKGDSRPWVVSTVFLETRKSSRRGEEAAVWTKRAYLIMEKGRYVLQSAKHRRHLEDSTCR